MTCKCGWEFCWLCLGLWKDHGGKTGGYYACNKYETAKTSDSNVIKAEQEISNAKQELARYQFHYERYQNHGSSYDLVEKQMVKIRNFVTRLRTEKQFNPDDLKFFEEVAKSIQKCRLILKWTYAVCFFAKGDIDLFKFQQEWLEDNCEKTHEFLDTDLSKFLTEDPDPKPFYEFKESVQK